MKWKATCAKLPNCDATYTQASGCPPELVVIDAVRLHTDAFPSEASVVEVSVRDAFVVVCRDVDVGPSELLQWVRKEMLPEL